MLEFFQMGGHGLYVWLSYGLAALILVFNIVRPLQYRKTLVATAKRRARPEYSK